MTYLLRRVRLSFFFGLFTALLLVGCSTTRQVESNVNSYSTLSALPSPPTYRLERLPSQAANAVRFDAIESQAQQALANFGLQRDDSNATLVLQLGAEAGFVPNPYWGPAYGYPYWGGAPFYGRMGFGFGRGGGWGVGMGGAWMMDTPTPLYHRKVSLILRDASTQKIVYETSAVYEDVWTDDPAIYGVLFNQALAGFPTPPQGTRVLRTLVDKQTTRPVPAAGSVSTSAPAPAPAPAAR
ncbi:DUF4136 domain-containing protein [Diaphorobacter aerolatus]|uniref:DUF4136 domain-containing protein n=1 Tax=Diaphorobacter aerolatus TaxID=1288495 RepID=A0A7H0GP02_9BURK|nr:DUF4136 domain-containing protein [Diaphorobacter aerolatus]QNP50018.1 hypothetical protein H9K75_09305 [Diaphorobacter aerolatus]